MTNKFALTALAILAITLLGAPMIASAHTATAGLGEHGAHHRHHHHHHHRH